MNHTKIILIGADLEIVELAKSMDRISVFGIVDAHIKKEYSGVPIIGDDNFIVSNKEKYTKYPVVITLDDTIRKKDLFDIYSRAGFTFINLISTYAKISPTAQFGKGCIIQSGVHLSTNTISGDCVKYNVNANIMHDGVIGDFCTIAPNAVSLGYSIIGDCSFIGANSTILPKIKIGSNVIVGAGAVVTKDLDDDSTYVGNPVHKLVR